MQDWSIPLVVATAAFLAVLMWRFRPMVGWGRAEGASREALREAQARVDAARDDAGKALALCDAAALVGPGKATGFYLRAIRTDPRSLEVVRRTIVGLTRRPRRLESLLWRHLALLAWNEAPQTTHAVLEALRVLYEGPLRNAVRANALAHARDTVEPAKERA